MPSARLIGVGVFVIGGFLLFAVGLFLIGERRMLFVKSFEVYAEFKTIAGLQPGAKVRVAGMDAGEVLDIDVPAGPAAPFRVRVSVREDLHPLVRSDSIASIQNDGLVGNKFVQVGSGSDRAPRLPNRGTIRSVEPYDIADLMQQASETVATIHTTVKELSTDIQFAVRQVAVTAEDANRLIDEVGVEVKAITRSGTRIAGDAEMIVRQLRTGEGTISKLINDDELHRRATQIAQDAERAVQNVREASEEVKRVVGNFRTMEGPTQGVLSDFRGTLGQAREAMSDLAENAEALKRSFFFRGYFNRRGYFDLDDLSVGEYRAGALETNRRRALRIWLGAPVMFAVRSDGSVALSDGGRARLDSVMADFLRHPANSPIVVEGFATTGTFDERFLTSRARAAAVREYLIGKFHLAPERVGLMAIGSEAPGSPAGDTWDGVAVALFTGELPMRRDGGTAVPAALPR